MKRKPTLRDRNRRRESNWRFKFKGERGWMRCRRVRPSQAHLRSWQLRDQERRQFSDEAPRRLAKAVMNSLVYRYRQGRGYDQVRDANPSKCILDFWISWLKEIDFNVHPAAGGWKSGRDWFEEREIARPIWQLIDALEDVKSGTRSSYTAAFFGKKKRGDRRDPEDMASFKKDIGLTCRLLHEIGFRTQGDAVKRINRELQRFRMRHGYTLDRVKKWMKSVTDEEFESHARIYIQVMMTADENFITNWADLSSDERQLLHYVCSETPIYRLVSIWKHVVESVRSSFPSRSRLEKYKLLRLWMTHIRVNQNVWLACRYRSESLKRFEI